MMPKKNNKVILQCLSFFIFIMMVAGNVNVCAQNSNSGSSIPIPDFIYEMRVEEAWKNKDFKKVQSLLDEGLQSYPGNTKLWDYQAGVALKQKNYIKAIEAANQALKLFPNPLRHSNLGWIHHQFKQYEKAIKHFKLGLKQGSKWHAHYFYLADCLERTGQKHEAIKYYQQYLNVASVGSVTIEAEKRLALLQQSGVSGGFGLTAAQKRQQDDICNKKYPGRIVVNFDPFTKEVECGCPDDAIDTNKGCLCKLEIEIKQAVIKKDIDQAERLAAQADQQSCKVSSEILKDVKFLVKIKRETPWMLNKKTFNEEMARRDREFNKAMREHDEQTRKNDELWAQMSKNILESQMKIISGIIGSTNTPAPGEPGPGVHPPSSYITFDDDEEEEEEMGDRIILLGEPVTDEDDPGGDNSNWFPPLNVPQDTIVGIWQNKLYKLNISKNGPGKYLATVVETYPIPTEYDKKKITRYPFAPGEICCKVGKGGGGGSGVFLDYPGGGWVWDGKNGRKWKQQSLELIKDAEGLKLRLTSGEAGGHPFWGYYMRKIN
ncbi:MAG: tetratricopeptide repeat protein [Desulfobacteraceae bacterium]|nr:tetratricopeptide repeat protein [Desulfobacteraceae bacterium]